MQGDSPMRERANACVNVCVPEFLNAPPPPAIKRQGTPTIEACASLLRLWSASVSILTCRVGHNRVRTTYMAVCMVNSPC